MAARRLRKYSWSLKEMNKTLLLIRIQLKNLFFSGKAKNKIQSLLPMAISFGVMVYLALFYTNLALDSLPAEYRHYIIFLMTGGCAAFLLIMGVTVSMGMLFGFKDFDFLSALPISKDQMITSKISTFLIYEYLYAFCFMVPMLICYGIKCSVSVSFYIIAFLGLTVLPLVPIVAACLIGLVIKSLSSRAKHQNYMSTILTFFLLLAVFIVSFSMNSQTDAQNMQTVVTIGSVMKTVIPTAGWYSEAVLNENWSALLTVFAVSLVSLLLFIKIMSPIILKIGAVGNQGYHVSNFKLKRNESKSKSVINALLDKELRSYFGNAAYVGNTLFPSLIMLIGIIYAAFTKSILSDFLNEGLSMDLIAGFLIVATGLMVHSSATTGVTISLEGQKLWILQTLPLKVSDIFKAKLFMSIAVDLIPAVLSLILVQIALQVSPLFIPVGIIYLFLVALFGGLFGLSINLRFPKLDWDREIIVIKQSASSMITVFGGMILGVAMGALFVSLTIWQNMDYRLCIALFAICYLAADLIMIYDLKHNGEKRFRRLA
ncbi:MAG: hypothetical protein EOM64_04670 [Erysipelotrichia bacterium]|nr:hypothetical protein [Erysipelotrichia bacterium]